MIKEFKLDKKVDAKKKHNQPKHKKNHSHKKTKKNIQQNVQKGGNVKNKDKFEVTTLSNIDPSKFSISSYMNANIDYGMCPGAPPTDCSIM
jgi:hypothetical protein